MRIIIIIIVLALRSIAAMHKYNANYSFNVRRGGFFLNRNVYYHRLYCRFRKYAVINNILVAHERTVVIRKVFGSGNTWLNLYNIILW